MRWTLTQAGDASPDEVWRRCADLDRWPRGARSFSRWRRQLTGAPPVVLAYLAPAQLALRSLVRA